jgi:hypothetical protein
MRDACAREPRTAQPIYKKANSLIRINPHCEPKQMLTAGKLKSLQTSYKGKRIGMVILASKYA